MKIVFDSQPGDDVERHARFLHREMLKNKNLPRIAAATRAMIPDWCDDCGDRAWGPIMGGSAYCPDCRTKREARNGVGF